MIHSRSRKCLCRILVKVHNPSPYLHRSSSPISNSISISRSPAMNNNRVFTLHNILTRLPNKLFSTILRRSKGAGLRHKKNSDKLFLWMNAFRPVFLHSSDRNTKLRHSLQFFSKSSSFA